MLQIRLKRISRLNFRNIHSQIHNHGKPEANYVLSLKLKELSSKLSDATNKIENLEKGRRIEVDNLYNNLLDRVIELERKSYEDSLLVLQVNDAYSKVIERISLLEEQTEPLRRRQQKLLTIRRYFDFIVIAAFILIIVAAWSAIFYFGFKIVWEYIQNKPIK